ncbi:MAG TPA: hypothetical protein VGF22_12600 [Acidimicrobiales bacterium]|jgi:hypothetical protein
MLAMALLLAFTVFFFTLSLVVFMVACTARERADVYLERVCMECELRIRRGELSARRDPASSPG